MVVRMAKHFWPGHPPFIPRPSFVIRDLEERSELYFMWELLEAVLETPLGFAFATTN